MKRLYLGSLLCFSFALAGCGAPDLSAMQPQVQKSAAIVVDVDNPPFGANATTVAEGGSLSTEVLHATAGDMLTQVDQILANQGVNGVVIAVHSANSILQSVSQLARQHPNVRFVVVSDWPATLPQLANLSALAMDPDTIAYAIGYLVGVNMNALVAKSTSTYGYAGQPKIGYLPSSAPSDEQKAFFAGLYQSDPAANVIPLVSLNGPGFPILYPTVSVAVVGNQPSAAQLAAISAQTATVYSFAQSLTGTTPAIGPGHLASSRVRDALAQLQAKSWSSGQQSVVDLSSVSLNTAVVPASVVLAWAKFEVDAEQTASSWQAQFAALPPTTRAQLANEFGLS
ncbi:type 1 periplasmic-binding domain-containing protein [Alicyclobacillus hesperidum]|uniref:hypothetical protein n=1 Tax=Alicyclobacillus hesperidum TaxID=89784 RepID=UPI002493B768|nr:hypothetical protein [Alicyclobacillus hesperidum]